MTAGEQLEQLPAAPRVILEPDADQQRWLEVRHTGIGGSDAAAVCGLDRWRSPFAVWLDKVADDVVDDDELVAEAARWGTILEPVVRDEVADREGLTIVPTPGTLQHPDRSWQLVNLDGLVVDDTLADPFVAVYEGKTAGHWSAAAWADGAVPEGYTVQVLHALDVTGLDEAVVGVLIAGQRLEVRRIVRDDGAIEAMRAVEAAFWQDVIDRRPPQPGPADADLIGELYGVEVGKVATLDRAEVQPLLDEYRQAAAEAKAADDRKKAAANALKLAAGDAEVLEAADGGRLFTYKQHERRDLDVGLLRQVHGDLVAAFDRSVPQRRLYVPKQSN